MVQVDIEFVIKESRNNAEIKHCPSCQKINRGPFPETMPGPLQYRSDVIAFAADLMISQIVPLKRTAQMLKMMCGRQISDATLLKWMRRLHQTWTAGNA